MKNYAYESLRRDLSDFISRLNFHGDEVAKEVYLSRIDRANEEKLIEIAKECNFMLSDYETEPVLKGKR